MSASRTRTSITAKGALALLPLLSLVGLVTPGCYLAHVGAGQLRLLRARQSIETLLADDATSPELRERLRRVQRVRRFAADLGLEVSGQYTSYAPWPGRGVVTTLVATRPGEVESAGFRYPFLGRLPYKGFFERERAEAEAQKLRARGLDVCDVDVPAYSTLGWFDDPVTGPMLRQGDEWLVETVIHELVHATVFLRDAPDFNEAAARFVGEEGGVAFFADELGPQAARRQRERVEDGRRVVAEIVRLRDDVAALYASREPGPERQARRAELETRQRAAIAALPLATRDAAALAERLRLNDACLALTGTYAALLPRLSARLARDGGDLRAFVAGLRRVAGAPDPALRFLGP